MIKTLIKWGKEGNFFILTKAFYEKPSTDIILTWGKAPLRSETKQGCSLSHFLFNVVLEVLVSTKKARKKIKRYSDCKWRNEPILLCRQHDLLCKKILKKKSIRATKWVLARI